MDILKVGESSVITEIGYLPKRAILMIRFINGTALLYRHVWRQEYMLFLQATSKGTYYNRYIKGVYVSMPWTL